jgi:hypothetical protein
LILKTFRIHKKTSLNSTFWCPKKQGLNCCSDQPISFHLVKSTLLYMLEYLIYHVRPYSVVRNSRIKLPSAAELTERPSTQAPTTSTTTKEATTTQKQATTTNAVTTTKVVTVTQKQVTSSAAAAQTSSTNQVKTSVAPDNQTTGAASTSLPKSTTAAAADSNTTAK